MKCWEMKYTQVSKRLLLALILSVVAICTWNFVIPTSTINFSRHNFLTGHPVAPYVTSNDLATPTLTSNDSATPTVTFSHSDSGTHASSFLIPKQSATTPVTVSHLYSGTANISTNSAVSINQKSHGSFVLSLNFGGQLGAGMGGLVLLQCFVSNLGIPAHVVEPFVINSVLRHTHPPGKHALLKFSDFFDIDAYNLESEKLGYGPLLRWEHFLNINRASKKAILVQFQNGGQKGTHVEWDASNTASSCYDGKGYPDLKMLINATVCVVRIVRMCCVKTDYLKELSKPDTIMTIEELRHDIFGKWTPEQMTILFQHWTGWWHVPETCTHKGIEGNIYPSERIRKYAKEYKDTFLTSNRVVAFLLRFENLLLRNYNYDVCLQKFLHVSNNPNISLTNASIFVAADIGKYQSGSWDMTFSKCKIDHKGGEQIMKTFLNTLSDFTVNHWNFEEWDNSFDKITGGIEDIGYIATLQKSIAAMADCLVFLVKGHSNFQNLLVQEYMNLHPTLSEPCIQYICTNDCQNCSHHYTDILMKFPVRYRR